MGCSGVIRQVFNILNYKKPKDLVLNKASYADLIRIKQHIISNSNNILKQTPGLRKDRIENFPPGLAILCALFEIWNG